MSDPKNPFEGANPFAAMFSQAQEMAKSFPAMEAKKIREKKKKGRKKERKIKEMNE